MYRYSVFIFFFLMFLMACRTNEQGCTDPLASNLDPGASINDGSCIYDRVSIAPLISYRLDEVIRESSGLLAWDGYLWTHNDNGPSILYRLDPETGNINNSYRLSEEENHDWEALTQDEKYIYIGAFGNNASGNRSDLHILKIPKDSLKSGNPVADTIWFSYSAQDDLTDQGPNQTDFDCEAFIVEGERIFLFTKQWVSTGTTVYSMPNSPGTYQAEIVSEYGLEGMVTGATVVEDEDMVVLCGYTLFLQPFLYLIYDFEGNDFFSGNVRRVFLNMPFTQVEGIAYSGGKKFYISNEYYETPPVGIVPQGLHLVELTDLF